MRENKVVFLAETEYHLMVSINIALSAYNTEEYSNDIYYWVSDTRLNYKINQVPELRGSLRPLDRNDRVNEIKKIAQLKPICFFFFREGDILLKYLVYQYKRNGAKICLAPDGYKPYGLFNKKYEWLSMVIDTVNNYAVLLRNRFFLPRLFLSWNYRYGSFRLLDEIHLHEPSLFDVVQNRTRGIIRRLPEWDDRSIKLFSKAFAFDNSDLKKTSGIFFYVNQPLWSEVLIEKEFEILRGITEIFPGRSIVIKLHPTTKKSTIKRYSELIGVEIIQDNRPAELYISRLKNCVIFSGWSGALIVNKTQNHYYYTFPIFKSVKDKILDQLQIVCFPHIQMISSVREISMPSLS